MSTVYGVQATIAKNNSGLIEQGYVRGKVYCLSDKYAFTADMAADDVIVMGGKLPKGARIVDARLINTAMSAGTISVGWLVSADAAEAADADGIMASVDVTSAASTSAAGSHYTCAWVNNVLAGEVQPTLTVATDTSATSGTYYLDIYFVID